MFGVLLIFLSFVMGWFAVYKPNVLLIKNFRAYWFATGAVLMAGFVFSLMSLTGTSEQTPVVSATDAPVVAATAQPVATIKSTDDAIFRAYDSIKVGETYYFEGDGGKPTHVCTSYKQAYLAEDLSQSVTDDDCAIRSAGEIVKVISIVPQTGDTQIHSFPMIQMQSIAHGWTGWSESMWFVRLFKPGTTGMVNNEPNPGGVTSSGLSYRRGEPVQKPNDIDLKNGTTFRILKQVPPDGDVELYVEVTSGPYKGHLGWMLTDDVLINGVEY